MLMRLADVNERQFYEIEAVQNSWTLRELKWQFDSALYLRLALSADKIGLTKLANQEKVLLPSRDDLKKILEERLKP